MYLLNVLVQHKVYSLDKEFFYASSKPVSVGARVAIKFNNSEIIGFVNSFSLYNGTLEEASKEYGFDIFEISSIIDDSPIINDELLKLAKQLSSYYFYPLIGVLQTMLPPSLRPKTVLYNAPKIKYEKFYTINREKLSDLCINSKIEKILKKFDGRLSLKTSELSKSKTLSELIDSQIIEIVSKETMRYKAISTFNYEEKITLTEEQNTAYLGVLNSDKTSFLIKGVTGSGKTEIYIKLAEKILQENKTVIVLVPEIALTSLMISRFLSYFKDGVAVLHSSLSDAQKYDEYRKISRGEAKITIGTRSAIFAPNKNLGLIIIDEENDECYKQDDQFLLYNAKEVALLRAKNNGAKVVFGSATPSIDLMSRALKNDVALFELKNRYKNVSLPKVSLVDRSDFKMFSSKSSVYSLPTILKIKETLDKNGQVMILINSRGYSKSVVCRECGHVFKCPRCNLPLHYHKNDNSLYCHHCEYKIKKPSTCPDCGSSFFSFSSFGIEKAEEDFKKIFNVPYLVLDSDRTPKSSQIEDILDKFNKGIVKVLIGTQIVAKGHDFKNVTLSVVLNADALFNFPNYRSNEMTFSLLTQMIGRSGRESGGEAIIQSSFPKNEVILFVLNQDYDGFYNYEIKNRQKLSNPPFMSIVAFELTSKKYETLGSVNLKNYLASSFKNGEIVLGPSLIRMEKGQYLTRIFVKYKKLSLIKETISDLIQIYSMRSDLHLRINFNPYSF